MKKIILLLLLQITVLMAITFNVTNDRQLVLSSDNGIPPVIDPVIPPVIDPVIPPVTDPVTPPVTGNGNTYYIDVINGNDSNAGTSNTSAWKTLAKVSSIAFSAGDNILFKRGQVFFAEKSFTIKNGGAEGNPIIYGAYGSGDKPIITSVKNSNISWVNTGNNIWKSSNTFAYHPERLKRNGSEILRAQDMAELGTKVPALIEWRYENNFLYLYSITDPNNDTFTTSALMITVDIGNMSNVVMQELDIQGGSEFSLRWLSANNTKLISMNIGAFSGEGFRYSGGTNLLIDGCNFDSDWPKSLDYTGISGSSATDLTPRGIQEATTMTGTASNITIRNSIFKNWQHASISVVATGNYDGLKIYNNYFTAPDIAYGGKNSFSYNANNIEYYNNTHEKFYCGRTQDPSMSGNNGHYHHNLYKDMWITPLKDHINWGFSIAINADSKNVIIEDNAFIRSEPGAIKLCGGSGKILRKNIIIDSNYPVHGYGGIVICDASYINSTTIVDNNIYDSSTQNNAVFYKSRPYSISEFNALQPRDGDTISGNYSSSDYSLDGIGCDFIDK